MGQKIHHRKLPPRYPKKIKFNKKAQRTTEGKNKNEKVKFKRKVGKKNLQLKKNSLKGFPPPQFPLFKKKKHKKNRVGRVSKSFFFRKK